MEKLYIGICCRCTECTSAGYSLESDLDIPVVVLFQLLNVLIVRNVIKLRLLFVKPTCLSVTIRKQVDDEQRY